MSRKVEGQDILCKTCYFYERCKIVGKECNNWLHFEYPIEWRKKDTSLNVFCECAHVVVCEKCGGYIRKSIRKRKENMLETLYNLVKYS